MLPPCHRTLHMKILRAQYVTILWRRAVTACPGENLSPLDCGWYVNKDYLLVLKWCEGSLLQETIFKCEIDAENVNESDQVDDKGDETDESDDEAWSEDSDSDGEVDS